MPNQEIVQRVEQRKKATASMAAIGVMSAFCSMKDAATCSPAPVATIEVTINIWA